MIKATKSLPFLFFYIKILRLTMKEYKTVEFENSDEFIEKIKVYRLCKAC